MTAEPNSCPSCGAVPPADAPQGFCPRCLYRLGLDEELAPPPPAGPPGEPAPGVAGYASLPCAFGDYELLEEVARGGMGVVYRARQRSLDRVVAVKMMLGGVLAAPEFVRRFRTEASAAAVLHHPNIVAIHEVGVHAGQHYFSMDLVVGPNLARLVGQVPLAAGRAARYVKQMAEAVHHAHQHGILHRDLKPSNVLIDAHDQPRITDFGLAKRLEGGSSVTLSGQMLGSPNFMPPEQAGGPGARLGRECDVYGLGAILYFLLTARAPFQADSLEAVVSQVLNREPVPPRLLQATIPRDLETLCLKCLEKEPRRRFATAQDLADELDRFLENRPILARPLGRAGKLWRWCRRKPVVAGLAVALTLACALGLGGVLGQWHRAERNAREEARQRRRAEAEASRAEAGETRARQSEYVADMNLAQHALQMHNLGRARALLEKHRPIPTARSAADNPQAPTDLRGWEWRFLWPQCQSDAVLTLGRHDNAIGAVAFTPDGRLLAARDAAGVVMLWDLAGRQEIARWSKRAFQHRAAALSPRGSLLAIGGYATNEAPCVELWDVTTRRQVGALPHGAAVVSMAFSPEGGTLATFAGDRTVRLWNLARGQLSARFDAAPESGPHKGTVAFSPDGRTLAVGDTDGRIRLLALHSPTGSAPFQAHPEGDGITALVFSADGRILASASGYSDGTIRLWAVPTGRSAGRLSGHSAWVPALALTPDGKTLASAGADHTIRLWDIEQQRCLATLYGSASETWCLAFSPHGQQLAGGGKDGSICFWDPRARPRAPAVGTLPAAIGRLVFSPDSRTFNTLKADGSISLWDATTTQETATHAALGRNNTSLAMSPDGNLLVAGTDTGAIRIWDRTAQLVRTNLAAHGAPVLYLQFGAAGRLLVSLAGDRTLKVWAVPAWRETSLCRLDRQVWPFEPEFDVSPDGRWAAVSDALDLAVWDLATGRKVKSFSGGFGWIDGLAFSPDGRLLAITGTEGTVRLFEVATWREVAALRGHLLGIHSVAFSPDGRRLATGSNLKEAVKLWDLATFQEVATLEGQGTYFSFTAFSPDGHTLVAVNLQGTAHFWHAPSFREIETARPAKGL